MLSSDEIKRLEWVSVQRERQRYSDADLWAWLTRLKDREGVLIQQIEIAYAHAFSWRPHDRTWRTRWEFLCKQFDAGQSTTKLVAWHLTKRGHENVASWLSAKDGEHRALAAKAQTAAWRMANE